MSKVIYSTNGSIAIIKLNNSPVNAFDVMLRKSVAAAVDQAETDSRVKVIILIGSEKAFSGGAEIDELIKGEIFIQPDFPGLCSILEMCSKPTIAAIGGVAFGGGLEPALGCHYRVATPDAKVGQLEITMGLMPGGSGSQRLPRLVGIEKAVNMIVSGKPVSASKLKDSGLFDEIIEGDLLAGAIAFAEKIIAKGCPIKRVKDIKINNPGADAYLQAIKNNLSGTAKINPAPLKCVEAIEACLTKSFEDGLQLEQELFTSLLVSSRSKALMHLFLAEKAVPKIPDVPSDTSIRKIEKVAIVGSGVMGSGVALVFLNAGIPVTLLARSQGSLDKSMASIDKTLMGALQKGKMTQEQFDKVKSLFKPSLSYDDLKDADLIIEAIMEDMGAKKELFKKLDEVAKPGAILASNTSSLDLNVIASFTKRPQDVIGMHFFNPANLMKLLEVVRGQKTAIDVIATIMDVCKKVKKIGVLSGVCDGFIGNRILFKYLAVTNFLVEQGASPQQIDSALEKWGMAMGPFRMQDSIGLDVLGYIRERQYAEHPDMKKEIISDKLFKMGRFGQKTGGGWYRYEPGVRGSLVDPVVDKIIEETRREMGIEPRKISNEEIVQRCLYSIINEGTRILEEGIALRASDIDVVYVNGYGFPALKGGPMQYADTVSPYMISRALNRYSQEAGADPHFWKPATLLQSLADEGKTFN